MKKITFVTKSFDEWINVISNEVPSFSFDVELLTNHSFKGCVDSVGFNNGVKFMRIKASSQRVTLNAIGNKGDIYVIASENKIRWENGPRRGELVSGGVIAFNCNESLDCEFLKSRNSVTLFLPFNAMYSEHITKSLNENSVLVYGSVINDIIMNMDINDVFLYQKIQAIFSLLVLARDDILIENKWAHEYKRIKLYILNNITNEELSLISLSKELGFSTRKVQFILASNDTPYKKILNEIRIEALMNKMEFERHKKISQMCYESGFTSTNNALIQFKKTMGISMREYKKQRLDK